MKPPICCICHRGFDPDKEGGLVWFAKRTSDIEWDRWIEETGDTGHPPYADWYCAAHIEQAHSLSHLTIDAAFARLGLT